MYLVDVKTTSTLCLELCFCLHRQLLCFLLYLLVFFVRSIYNNNNNKQIFIVPLGRNFSSALFIINHSQVG